MKILVTGAAGFIGSKISFLLSQRGDEVVGIDNINDYYDVRLKHGRLAELGIEKPAGDFEWNTPYTSSKFPAFKFIRMGIEDKSQLDNLFASEHFDKVINLAAQAGVRYSITNPYAYLTSNLVGFLNIIECCRNYPVKHLLFASSSSVYGLNTKAPFSEEDKVDAPVSLYAASKKSNELMAHSYSKLYGIPATGLRYFTVYGPWGRPDMAPMLFADAITHGRPINVFNNGDMIRDFTYIDDIAFGSIQCLDQPPVAEECPNNVPFRVYNIGCSNPVRLMDFINEIETAVGQPAEKIMKPMQPGDVYMTNADTTRLEQEIGYKPKVNLHEGIANFIEWYKSDKNPLR
ncbi:MAG: NAD-dependent epimerase [Bacteroidales bacterium]|nr:NAD-dependent epimerase [Bacteroidales bacterium]